MQCGLLQRRHGCLVFPPLYLCLGLATACSHPLSCQPQPVWLGRASVSSSTSTSGKALDASPHLSASRHGGRPTPCHAPPIAIMSVVGGHVRPPAHHNPSPAALPRCFLPVLASGVLVADGTASVTSGRSLAHGGTRKALAWPWFGSVNAGPATLAVLRCHPRGRVQAQGGRDPSARPCDLANASGLWPRQGLVDRRVGLVAAWPRHRPPSAARP